MAHLCVFLVSVVTSPPAPLPFRAHVLEGEGSLKETPMQDFFNVRATLDTSHGH